MRYKVNISGMHCRGCQNLIEMVFKDHGIESIQVDLDLNMAIFDFQKGIDMEKVLGEIFSELEGYSFCNIQNLN